MKNKIITSFLLCFIAFVSYSQPDSKVPDFNFGFEKTTKGEALPDNWFRWGMMDYDLIMDTTITHSGKHSMLIIPTANRKAETFGCVAQKIPSIYEGKEIEVSVYMKMDNVAAGHIGLMIRIDGVTGTLEFENTVKGKIEGTADWKKYSTKVPYPKLAKDIYIGAMLTGTGKLWVDDFEVSIDGIDIHKVKPAPIILVKAETDNEFDKESNIELGQLNDEKIADFVLLGQVWGFLKYYHPGIAKGDFNWDNELFRIIPKINLVQNTNERDRLLVDWIKSLGLIEENNKTEKLGEIKLRPDLTWISDKGLSKELGAELNKVKNAKRSGENYYVSLIHEVGNPDFTNERSYREMKYPDAGFRILALYRYWNMIHYFFPYKNLIGEDWNLVLKEFIPKFIDVKNELEYKLTLLEIIGRVHDTHANIWSQDSTLQKYWGQKYAPYEISFIENKAVVTGFYGKEPESRSGLQIGDIITRIQFKSVDSLIKERLIHTPASNYPTQLRNIADKLLRTNDAFMHIEFIRNGKTESAMEKTFLPQDIDLYWKYSHPDTCFKILDNNTIAYLYPGSIKNEYLPAFMDSIKNTRGLVIDFRCYPSDFIVFSLSEYLMPKSTAFVKFSQGNIKTPGLFTMTQDLKVGKKNKDYYKGKIVIIVNESTQSSAEYHSMAFRAAPNVTVMGSTTAGADGNVSKIFLPGGIRTMISGIGVYYPDGKETQRVGIIPDIEVKPTIEGVKMKKDEVLDRAIEIIKMK